MAIGADGETVTVAPDAAAAAAAAAAATTAATTAADGSVAALQSR